MAFLRYCFNLACFATALGMTILWVCRYFHDEDSIQLDLKPFDFPQSQRPMLSFCFMYPFIEDKLKEYNDTLTGQKYTEMLIGSRSHHGFENINFDKVTLNLAIYYLSDAVEFRNGSYKVGSSPNFLHEIPMNTYSGYFRGFFKCFGLTTKFTEFEDIKFSFNSSVFRDGIRPSGEWSGESIFTLFHLPNKIVLSGNFDKSNWPQRKEKKEYQMNFDIQLVEILKRRSKSNSPCISDDLNFDQMIFDDHLQEVGCRTPNQKTNKNLNVCNSNEKMKEASSDFIGKKKSIKACTTMSTITFAYQENNVDLNGSDWFHLKIHYPDQYKEIVMIRAVDIETVIANAGGYIGLFLGIVDAFISDSQLLFKNA